MEAVKLPLRELRKRYTRSEMFIMAWRSSEIAHNMGNAVRQSGTRPGVVDQIGSVVEDRELSALESRLSGIEDKLENADGELDLRQLTGEQARQFMGAFGISVPEAGHTRQLGGSDDPVSQAYRDRASWEKKHGR